MTDYLSEIDTYEHSVESRDASQDTLAVRDAAIGLATRPSASARSRLDGGHRRHRAHGSPVAGGEDKLRERPLVYFCECPSSR